MKSHVEYAPGTDRVRVWLFVPRFDRNGSDFLGPDLQTLTFVEAGGETPEPTIDAPQQIVEALASALANRGRPSEATRDHLLDAIAVRDRLLTLVEKST